MFTLDIDDSNNFMLITFAVISHLYLFFVCVWPVKKVVYILDVLYMSAVSILSIMVIHTQFKEEVPIAFDIKTGGVSSLVIAIWIAIYFVAPGLIKALTYILTFFLIFPLVFYQTSHVIASTIATVIGMSVNIWIGFSVLVVITIFTVWFCIRNKILERIIAMIYLIICSLIIFVTIRLCIIEGPAPYFANINIVCFDQALLDRCPFGIEDYYLFLCGGIFLFVLIVKRYCSLYCHCSNTTEEEEEEEEKEKEKKQKEEKKPKTKTKTKKKYEELVEEKEEEGKNGDLSI